MKWSSFLTEEFEKPYFKDLMQFVDKEYETKKIYPEKSNLFSVFEHTEFDDVKVVILGQDPYHGENQAHGLCFSVQKGVKIPPSLRNMFQELEKDLGIPYPSHGSLLNWANQGVFLLNTILSVEEGKPLSHQGKGWETFTDEVILKLNEKSTPVIFVLWGANARKKKKLITNPSHKILEGAHPSPLSAYRGFFGSCPFSKMNAWLVEMNRKPIDWRVDNV